MTNKKYTRRVGRIVVNMHWRNGRGGDKTTGAWLTFLNVQNEAGQIKLWTNERIADYDKGVARVNRFCDALEFGVLPSLREDGVKS